MNIRFSAVQPSTLHYLNDAASWVVNREGFELGKMQSPDDFGLSREIAAVPMTLGQRNTLQRMNNALQDTLLAVKTLYEAQNGPPKPGENKYLDVFTRLERHPEPR